MDIQTILALNEYNRQFYSQQAQSFAQKRQYFWPSWQRFLEQSVSLRQTQASVLDIGCGTGRFALFLDQEKVSFSYTGVDLSAELLAEAQENFARAQFPLHLIQYDLIEGLLSEQLLGDSGNADVISLFGVLHHIPSFALRQKLLMELAKKLNPGGELWLTLWNPQRAGESSPAAWPWPAELEREAGDELLTWKNSSQPRYVHWVSEEEEQKLLASLPLTVVDEWWELARGERGNHCYLLVK